MKSRREFLKGAALTGAAAFAGGCATRGAWKTAKPLGVVDMDTDADFKNFKLPKGQNA